MVTAIHPLNKALAALSIFTLLVFNNIVLFNTDVAELADSFVHPIVSFVIIELFAFTMTAAMWFVGYYLICKLANFLNTK